MNLLKDFPSVTTFIEDDTLKSHDLSRMAIFAAGTEQISINNVASYDPVAGRVNFASTVGGVNIKVLIID